METVNVQTKVNVRSDGNGKGSYEWFQKFNYNK